MGFRIGKEKIITQPLRVVHMTASMGIGGAEAVLCSLIENMNDGDVHHEVIAFRDGPYADRIRKAGVSVNIVHGLLCRYDPIFWLRVIRLIKRLKPDCIHSLLWISNCAARIIGKCLSIPVISGMHNNVVLHGKFRDFIDKHTLPLSTRIVTIHEGVYESIIARCKKHAQLPISVIHNCIDEKQIHARAAASIHKRAEFGLNDDHFIIGAVGRWIPIKRYSLLIRQFAIVYKQYPHARLFLIGYGPEEQNLRMVADSSGCCQAIHFIVHQQAFGYFPLFNCFVLPSLTEGPSIALLEAMSFSLPCIVTHDVPTHPVIMSGDNGLLARAQNEDDLGISLIQLIEDKMLCRSLGDHAKETVRSQFSVETMVTEYKKCFFENIAGVSVNQRKKD